MNRTFILQKIELASKMIRAASEPNYWPHENRSRAQYYQRLLPAIKAAYRGVLNGTREEAIAAVTQATTVIKTGIEHNYLQRALDAPRDNHGTKPQGRSQVRPRRRIMKKMNERMKEIAAEMATLNAARNAPSTSQNDRDKLTDHLSDLEAKLIRLGR